MKRPFLVVLGALILGVAGCGGSAHSNNGASMQPSTSDGDDSTDDDEDSADGSSDGNANSGGGSGGSSSSDDSSDEGGAGKPSGAGGVTHDPGSGDAGAGDDLPDDPTPNGDGGRAGFVECKPESRGAVACVLIYDPVCAEVNTGIVCITTPCPSTEYQQFGNSCEACSNEKVNGYWPGTCSDNDK